MTIWHMHIACWIPRATNTHSGYVILIAFPLQQRFHEHGLNVTLYVHCLSCWAYSMVNMTFLLFLASVMCIYLSCEQAV